MTKFSQSFKPEKSSNLKNKAKKLSKPLILILTAVFLLSAVGVYLFEINYIAAKGLKVRELEQKIELVKEKNKKLKLQMVEMKSMTDLSEKISGLNMQPIDDINYYQAGSTVARR